MRGRSVGTILPQRPHSKSNLTSMTLQVGSRAFSTGSNNLGNAHSYQPPPKSRTCRTMPQLRCLPTGEPTLRRAGHLGFNRKARKLCPGSVAPWRRLLRRHKKRGTTETNRTPAQTRQDNQEGVQFESRNADHIEEIVHDADGIVV